MERYKISCTPEQTRKAIELGAPLTLYPIKAHLSDEGCEKMHVIRAVKDGYEKYYLCPTAEQMIGFLRSKGIKFHFDDETNYWRVDTSIEPISISCGVSEQRELAAIDAALEYLKNNKK